MFLLIIFVCAYSYYAYKISRWLFRSLNGPLAYFYEVDPYLPENFKPFARLDRHKWSHFELYFCAIFLLPLRLLLTTVFTISYWLVITICDKIWPIKIEKDPFESNVIKNDQTPLKRKIIKFWGNVLARAILFCAGFYWISHKNAKISHYLREYKPPTKKRNAPFVISNHYSWLDIFHFISSEFCPSFLSKKDVISYPLIGRIAVGLQSLFVSRNDRNNKNEIIDLIEERAQLIRSGKNIPQILIFPEGTTTNGKYLISFKKGAFFTIDPIQIVCLKYEERSFALSYDVIGDIYCMIFPFCQFSNSLTVTKFDVFDPEYLNLDKRNEDHWSIYAEKVKLVMAKHLGLWSSEVGFNDKEIYYKLVRENMKKSTNTENTENEEGKKNN